MTKLPRLLRVCGYCLRPVANSYFIFLIGCTCPKHGRMDPDDTIKIPVHKANYEPTENC